MCLSNAHVIAGFDQAVGAGHSNVSPYSLNGQIRKQPTCLLKVHRRNSNTLNLKKREIMQFTSSRDPLRCYPLPFCAYACDDNKQYQLRQGQNNPSSQSLGALKRVESCTFSSLE
jgi:hypothetical protein